MKILYISTANSNKKYNDLFEKSNGELHHSIQKFHQLIISGLKENNPDITVLSGLQISNKVVDKKIFIQEKEKENGITYLYPFFINIPILKQIFTIISFILYFIIWSIKNKDDKKVIIDSAYISVAPIMVFLCKLFNINCACIVADIYNYMTPNVNVNQKRTFFEKIACKFCNYCWHNYDYFILLTEEMNKVINPLNKPHIVMEGLVDNKDKINYKIRKRQAIMYAGGLTERYGVKLLIDAFNEWNNDEYELWLCGNGDLVDYIKSIENKKIRYLGVLQNEDIIKLEKAATLLVNPRFSDEEYTKYSFPSKTMEYMLSGTPVLTTNLPGMPNDYKKYVYLVEEETINGYINAFNKLLLKKDESLNKIGSEAQEFVLKEKNNTVQANKILKLINTTIKHTNNINIVNKLIYLYLFVNIVLLLLSALNVYGLYSVSIKTYFIYILNIIFTLIGLKFTIKKLKKTEESNTNINSTQNKEVKIFKSNIFKYFLLFTFCCVLLYFIKYLYVIKDLPVTEIRMAAFDKLYSNAFSAVFYLYIVTNCVRFIELLLPIFIFDKKLKNIIPKKTICFMIIIILIYTFIGFARTSFLFLIIISLLSIIYFADMKKIFTNKNFIKILIALISIFLLSCLMIFFRITSDRTIASFFNSMITQFEHIFIYFLGSFRTLDHFLSNGFYGMSNLYFGRATLAGFDEIILYPIKFLGSEILSFNQIISPNTQAAISVGKYTNYYNAFFTSVMNFYLDFKIIGVIIFSFIHGLFIRYVTDLYKNKKSIISKCCLIFVSYNLLVSSLKWEYQSGNTIFLIIVLLLIETININKFWRKRK